MNYQKAVTALGEEFLLETEQASSRSRHSRRDVRRTDHLWYNTA
jgi:hypothetical protein